MSKKISLVAIILIIICTVFFLNNISEKPYVARVGNERISVPEYMIYLQEQVNAFEELGGADIWEVDFNGESSESVAKRNALNSVIKVKITNDKAKSMNIELDEYELATALEWAYQLHEHLSGESFEISLKELEQIMMETEIYFKVFEELTDNFELSEIDFNIYYENMERNISREDAKIIYISEKKNEIFDSQFEIWEGEFDIQRNTEVFESILLR